MAGWEEETVASGKTTQSLSICGPMMGGCSCSGNFSMSWQLLPAMKSHAC